MRAQGATPTVTPSPIPETSERLGPSSRGRQRQLKTECLGRDDYHCLLTPFWDPKAREIYPENQDIPANTIPTELCHIIPFAMGSYQTSHEVCFLLTDLVEDLLTTNKEPNLDRTWPTLSSLFPEIKEIAHLSPESINEHRNCLALMSLFHPPFRQFKLSFEPTVCLMIE